MNFNNYSYGGYPTNGYYNPPIPDQLAQLRGAQMQQPAMPMSNQQMQPQNNSQMQPQQPTQATNDMIWVQGEAAAKSYIIAPGNTVILWDSENPVIYIKSSDASGIPSMKTLEYTERSETHKAPLDSVSSNASNYVTRDEWAALTARVDALTSKSEQKSKKTNAKDNDE